MSANYCRHISHRSLFRGSSVTTLMNWLTSRKVLLSGAAAGLYTYDSIAGVGKINRGLRTVKTALWTLYDYKFCVDHEPIDTVHDRVAKRWYELCKANGGLFIKFGQSISAMNHILPPPFLTYFANLHDKAPIVPYEQCRKLFKEDFGKEPEDVFAEFDRNPVASASIAQVHKAKLKTGETVAVKIQKPYIRSQLPWDFLLYDWLIYAYEKAFDLPLYWTVPYVIENISREAHFTVEGLNTDRAREEWDAVPALKGKIYVPKVFWDVSSDRVLVTEWIDGVKITEKDKIENDMNLSVKTAMETMTIAFSRQIFITGRAHCDPHPGNVLVRPNPQNPTTPQVVVLDHGLYVDMSESFRQQYCDLWKSMVLQDMTEVSEITKQWGISDPEFFASLQLMRPYQSKKALTVNNATRNDFIELHLSAKAKIQKLLHDTRGIPRELLFVARQMNLVRSINMYLESPVNRVRLMAMSAAEGSGLTASEYSSALDVTNRLVFTATDKVAKASAEAVFVKYHRRQMGWSGYAKFVRFWVSMFVLEVYFQIMEAYRSLGKKLSLIEDAGGYEEDLEKRMNDTLEAKLGFKINVSKHGAGFG